MMETQIKSRHNYSRSANRKPSKFNDNVRAISAGAKFTQFELDTLSKHHADAITISDMTKVLPYRVPMQNALKSKGFPAPSNINDLSQSFYQNIVRKSKYGNHYTYIEGNPVLHKMSYENNSVTSTINTIPAIFSFIDGGSDDPTLNAQFCRDKKDINDFIIAKNNGENTDNVIVANGTISFNPWIVGLLTIIIVYLMIK